MSRKPKLTKEEQEMAREARLDNAEKRIQRNIAKLEENKKVQLQKILEVRALGLQSQERDFRRSLQQCMAQIKTLYGMLYSIQHNRLDRDIVSAQREFVGILDDITDDILRDEKKTKTKKVKKKLLRSKYATEKQAEKIDDLLEAEQYAGDMTMDSSRYNEFDAEIDAMIENASGNMNANPRNKDKNRY